MKLFKQITTATALATALGACQHGDPVTPAGGPTGGASLVSGSPLSASVPSGSLSAFTSFGGFVTNVTDAFSRKPADATVARRGRYFRAADYTFRWYSDVIRNTAVPSADFSDPRKPFIQGSGVNIDPNVGIMDLYSPNPSTYPDADYWELYTGFAGLKPSTTYEIAFVHYRLKVNGMEDHVERLLTGTVTQPDELVLPAGSTIAKVNYDWTGKCAGGPTYPASKPNPFVVSTFTSDPTGVQPDATTDKCWLSGSTLYTKATFDTPEKSMVGRGDDVSYSLPNYNYIEVWEGAYGQGAGPVARLQIAQDLDEIGRPVQNGYAPFPAPNTKRYSVSGKQTAPPVVEQQPSFPISDAVKPALKGAVGAPDSVSVTLNNLQLLDNGVYKAWYIKPGDPSSARPAVGRYTRVVGGVTKESIAATSTFKGGPGTITFVSRSYVQDIAPKTRADSLLTFFISQETDPNATTPNLSQPFWSPRIVKIPPVSAGGTLVFGSYNNGTTPVRFVPQGSVVGGVIGDTATIGVQRTINGQTATVRETQFVGSTLDMRFQDLQRPPVGYEYRAYLLPSSDTASRGVLDTLALLDLGVPTGPNGESLVTADVDPTSSNLSSGGILFAKTVFDAHSVQRAGKVDQLCNYEAFRLYLVPKTASPASHPTILVFNVGFPDRVTKSDSCR